MALGSGWEEMVITRAGAIVENVLLVCREGNSCKSTSIEKKSNDKYSKMQIAFGLDLSCLIPRGEMVGIESAGYWNRIPEG
jgi:hypothetical protein